MFSDPVIVVGTFAVTLRVSGECSGVGVGYEFAVKNAPLADHRETSEEIAASS